MVKLYASLYVRLKRRNEIFISTYKTSLEKPRYAFGVYNVLRFFDEGFLSSLMSTPEHDLYLGSLNLSTIKTRYPISARVFAAALPAGPDPITITSYITIFFPLYKLSNKYIRRS